MAEPKKPLGERLIEEGLITSDALREALDLQKRFGGRLGECLLELKSISESSLLRFLAAEYRTRYVATDKLARVKIPTEVLDKIPVRMAEQQMLIPIMVDPARKVISVVMAEPQNLAVIEEVRLVADMAQVYAYIARRSAITAAIKKHYYGDPTAFAIQDTGSKLTGDAQQLSDFYEHQAREGTPTGAVSFGRLNLPTDTQPSIGSDPRIGAGATSVRQAIDEVHRASLMSDNDFIETLNILVGLHEMRRKAFRGHSASVARHARTVAQKLMLPPRDVNYVIIAAYLHDLGKRSDRHLTLMSVGAKEEYQAEAKKSYLTPTRLFETVHLPVQVNSIVGHIFECFDGSGLPEGAAGERIPIGSRIIAAVDAYEDLTKNPGNAFGGIMGKDDALGRLEGLAGALFDPHVVEVLKMVHSGELLKQRLLGAGKRILLVEPDERAAAKLEGELVGRGFLVENARSSEAAHAAIRSGTFDLVISEVDIQPENGYLLCAGLRKEPSSAAVPFLFLSNRGSGGDIERGLAVGASDYVVKPANPEMLAGKVQRLLDQRVASAPPEAVYGSLDEMPIDQILRTIAGAKRSGALHVLGEGKSATVWLENGRVVHIQAGDETDQAAFSALLDYKLGEFSLDPTAVATVRGTPQDVELLFRAAETERKAKAAKAAALQQAGAAVKATSKPSEAPERPADESETSEPSAPTGGSEGGARIAVAPTSVRPEKRRKQV